MYALEPSQAHKCQEQISSHYTIKIYIRQISATVAWLLLASGKGAGKGVGA